MAKANISIKNRIDAAVACAQIRKLLWDELVCRDRFDSKAGEDARLATHTIIEQLKNLNPDRPAMVKAAAAILAEAPKLRQHPRARLYRDMCLVERAMGAGSELLLQALASWEGDYPGWEKFHAALPPPAIAASSEQAA